MFLELDIISTFEIKKAIFCKFFDSRVSNYMALLSLKRGLGAHYLV